MWSRSGLRKSDRHELREPTSRALAKRSPTESRWLALQAGHPWPQVQAAPVATDSLDMATSTKTERRTGSDLTREQLVGAYRTMLLARRLDDKEIQLKRQNKTF